jgi:hypothetical protein
VTNLFQSDITRLGEDIWSEGWETGWLISSVQLRTVSVVVVVFRFRFTFLSSTWRPLPAGLRGIWRTWLSERWRERIHPGQIQIFIKRVVTFNPYDSCLLTWGVVELWPTLLYLSGNCVGAHWSRIYLHVLMSVW